MSRHLNPTISQVHAVTMRRAKSKSLGLASQQALHTQNVNTDRGHLPQGVERRGRKRERDIRRVTEIETEREIEMETETETEIEKGMTDMEAEEMTGIEGKTGIGAEKMTEVEARGTQRKKTGMG